TTAPAGLAWAGDGFALTTAARAGRHLHHRSEEGLLRLTHFTRAVTLRTTHRRRSRRCTRTRAGLAVLQPLEFDFFFDAKDRLFKRDSHVHTAIRAGTRTTTTAGSHSADVSEEFFKNFFEATKTCRAAKPTIAGDSSVTAAVIAGAFLAVGENVGSFVDLCAALFRGGVLTHVRMISTRTTAKSRLDLLLIGAARNAEY